MKNSKNTSEQKNIIYEGIVSSFVNNPFAFLFGAHFMQSLLRAPEVGDDPEFEKWMEENGKLPDAVEKMKAEMGAKKLSPDEIRARGINFLGKDEKEAMAKAMNELPDELKDKFESRMTDKSIKSYANFQDSAKAALQATNEATKQLEADLAKISSTLKNSPAEDFFSETTSKQLMDKLKKDIVIYQKTIVQKINAFQEQLRDHFTKSNNKKMIGKLDLNPFTLDEILGNPSPVSSIRLLLEFESPEEAKKSAEMILSNLTDAYDGFVSKTEKSIKQLTKGLNNLKALLAADALGVGDMGQEWEKQVTKITQMWLSETQEVALQLIDAVESNLEARLSRLKKQAGGEQGDKVNESRKARNFYESFGDFS